VFSRREMGICISDAARSEQSLRFAIGSPT
jgi:hypothetical protein